MRLESIFTRAISWPSWAGLVFLTSRSTRRQRLFVFWPQQCHLTSAAQHSHAPAFFPANFARGREHVGCAEIIETGESRGGWIYASIEPPRDSLSSIGFSRLAIRVAARREITVDRCGFLTDRQFVGDVMRSDSRFFLPLLFCAIDVARDMWEYRWSTRDFRSEMETSTRNGIIW